MKEPYRIVLVDDEDDIRGRIASKITQDSGFVIVGSAGNGYDALDLIEEHRPHVVLTDIKMPFIDGLDLTRIIRRDYPTTKVAFISGYDEFDLARQAIELNVVSYLMKPVTANDITTFLTKLKTSLDHEYELLSNNQLIHKMYEQSIPMVINSYFSSYRMQHMLTENDISLLEQYGVTLEDGKYLVTMIGVVSSETPEEIMETKIFLGTLLDKTFSAFDMQFHYLVPEGVVCILKDKRLSSAQDVDLYLYEIIKYAEEFRSMSLAIGVSALFSSFVHYPNAFRESEEAMQYSQYFHMGQIMYFEDIEDREHRDIHIEDATMNAFEQAMKYGDKEEVRNTIQSLLEFTISDEDRFILDPQVFFVKVANSLINFAASIRVNISDIVTGQLVDTLQSYTNRQELQQFLYDTIMTLRKENVMTQVDKTDHIIEQIYEYIETNYQDPSISLETITQELGISISYLSMLLKQKKGVTYTKELIRYRMEKAKELLRYTTDKIISIAKQVGYNEVYYFSHSFKRYTGMSPKEFREHE